MDLLPKQRHEFASQAYWDTFFSKRTDQFEWYGDYASLKPLLQSLLKSSDCLLHVGCGNSSLGVDLHQDGIIKTCVNIDLNELVIQQQQKRYSTQIAVKQDSLQFKCMDILQLKQNFGESAFQAVLDKGTFDALIIDKSDSTAHQIKAMFAQIQAVLASFGKFICISLLQSHVLQILLDCILTADHCQLVRIHRIYPDNELFPVFVVVLIKLKSRLSSQDSPKTLFELCLFDSQPAQRTFDPANVQQAIRELQNYALLRKRISQQMLPNDEELCFELFDSQQTIISQKFKYRLYILDQLSRDCNKNNFAVFLVPAGREREFLFGSRDGRRKLAKLCSSRRLVVVHLNSNYIGYPELEQLKQELSEKVMELAPKGFCDKQRVPIMSVSEPKREILFTSESELSGRFTVADVEIENECKYLLRQLVFDSNRNVIQSEARIRLLRHKKRTRKVIDHNYLACSHHTAILYGLYGLFKLQTNVQNPHVLLVGLGGGCFASFVQHNVEDCLSLDVVEIDEQMVHVAKTWFELDDGNNNASIESNEIKASESSSTKLKQGVSINLIVQDGLKYISEPSSLHSYDIIIFDVDSKDSNSALSCPPAAFIAEAFLDQVVQSLAVGGLFILNLASRCEKTKQLVVERLQSRFARLLLYQVPEETNTVVYAFIGPDVNLPPMEEKDAISERLRELLGCRISDNSELRPQQGEFVEHLLNIK